MLTNLNNDNNNDKARGSPPAASGAKNTFLSSSSLSLPSGKTHPCPEFLLPPSSGETVSSPQSFFFLPLPPSHLGRRSETQYTVPKVPPLFFLPGRTDVAALPCLGSLCVVSFPSCPSRRHQEQRGTERSALGPKSPPRRTPSLGHYHHAQGGSRLEHTSCLNLRYYSVTLT
ncbi:hypothetical protein E2C01_008703 [Portunus trituberculatus]|uniref:Uncharacterized protein n=1 Tax=Portunus trituberculatus TaxID=210409 RepID=A0A5B7D327_PORTR|nr:hypothetical protein [Portunus trituberculatus]